MCFVIALTTPERILAAVKKLNADDAANSPGNCVANRAERPILERRSGGVATNDTSDYLNDKIHQQAENQLILRDVRAADSVVAAARDTD